MKKNVLFIFIVMVCLWVIHMYYRITKKLAREAHAQERYANVLQDWLVRDEKYNTTKKYFAEHPQYRNVAIYGAGSLAEVLFYKLKELNVRVTYIADIDVENVVFDFESTPLIQVNKIGEQEAVNCIIISPINYFDEINEKLQRMSFAYQIISLEDIVYFNCK